MSDPCKICDRPRMTGDARQACYERSQSPKEWAVANGHCWLQNSADCNTNAIDWRTKAKEAESAEDTLGRQLSDLNEFLLECGWWEDFEKTWFKIGADLAYQDSKKLKQIMPAITELLKSLDEQHVSAGYEAQDTLREMLGLPRYR